jgi:hypothetical protein
MDKSAQLEQAKNLKKRCSHAKSAMVSSKNPIQNVRTAEPSLRKKMKKFKKNHLEEDLLGHLEEDHPDQRRAEDLPDQRRAEDHPDQRRAEDHPDQRSQDHLAEDRPDQRSQDHLAEDHLAQRSQDHLAEDHLGQRRAEDRQKEVRLDLSVAHLDEGW